MKCNRPLGQLHSLGCQTDGSWRVLNWDCRIDEEEHSMPLLQLPPLCADWSGVVMQEEDLIHLAVWLNVRVHCFNFCNVCTY